MRTIPVVDAKDPQASDVLAKACRDVGFFYLENHGVPADQIKRVFDQSRALFAMPLDFKMSLLRGSNHRGYTPMDSGKLDPDNQTKGDTKEGFYVLRDVKEGDAAPAQLQGPSRWPDEIALPGWKDEMLAYHEAMHEVGMKVVELMTAGLDLAPDFFKGLFKDRMSALRLLHYSNEVSDPDAGIMGAGAHTDFGLLAIIATDDVPGLQVQLDGEWVDVPPRPGAFICNLGDMLQRWTNDHIRSTMHRVVNKLGQERYSIPFFLETDYHTKVTCLPQFCSEENPPKYPPTTSGEYLDQRLRDVYLYANQARKNAK